MAETLPLFSSISDDLHANPKFSLVSSQTSSDSMRTTEAMHAKKNAGRVYTPDDIVIEILDLAGYLGENILKRHVIDNSCGDGAFLCKIVERYCQACNRQNLKRDLEEFIHGIEIDPDECAKCRARLDSVAASFGITGVSWDVRCADALTVSQYDGKMDFVLGNPPYIRVHNLGTSFDSVKSFKFAQEGMTDLYLVFYEIGLNMLKDHGILGYITPSSFFNSLAGNVFRRHIVDRNLLVKIADLGHYQVFEATTYTAIVILEKSRTEKGVKVYNYGGELNFIDKLYTEDFYIDDKFFFSTKHNLEELKQILVDRYEKNFEVKNGFATLSDSFFIGDQLTCQYTIPVIKASTGKWTRALFPYVNDKLVPYEQLIQIPALKKHYEQNIDKLKKRSITSPIEWYGFGRTQGIKDVYKNKYSINSLIRDKNDIKLNHCPSGTGVFSGLYIMTELSFDELRDLICTDGFVTYVSLLKKYKSGGYYTFSSHDLKTYLEHSYVCRYGSSRGLF